MMLAGLADKINKKDTEGNNEDIIGESRNSAHHDNEYQFSSTEDMNAKEKTEPIPAAVTGGGKGSKGSKADAKTKGGVSNAQVKSGVGAPIKAETKAPAKKGGKKKKAVKSTINIDWVIPEGRTKPFCLYMPDRATMQRMILRAVAIDAHDEIPTNLVEMRPWLYV